LQANLKTRLNGGAIYRNHAQYSLDAGDGVEYGVCFAARSPRDLLELQCRFCQLCRALNSLPEKQGRRIEAHYIVVYDIIAENIFQFILYI
jgi:hypothetical protein